MHRLHENGHMAFLCTGRSLSYVPRYVAEIGLDGIVAGIGTYVEVGGRVLRDREMPREAASRTVRVLRAHGMIPVLEGTAHMYYDLNEYNTSVDWFADLITKQLGERLLPITGNEGNLHFGKLSAKRTAGCDVAGACAELAEDYDFIVHGGGLASTTVEMVPKGFTKATGMAEVCKAIGLTMADTVAFGDSNNDLAMLSAAGIAVAMGHSPVELTAVADYCTAAWDEGGITQALEHLGLI